MNILQYACAINILTIVRAVVTRDLLLSPQKYLKYKEDGIKKGFQRDISHSATGLPGILLAVTLEAIF